MDPIFGTAPAAEVRTVEQAKPARAVPFRYNRAREQIKQACLLLAQVKKEARGKVLLRREPYNQVETDYLAKIQALRLEYRLDTTSEVRREQIRAILAGERPEIQRLGRMGKYAPASKGAELILRALKARIQAMNWAWAIARATESDTADCEKASIQKIALQNGKWARVKLPDQNYRVDEAERFSDMYAFQEMSPEFRVEGIILEPAYLDLDYIDTLLDQWRKKAA